MRITLVVALGVAVTQITPMVDVQDQDPAFGVQVEARF